MHFLQPAGEGDILLFSAAINRTWRTSMEVGVKVVAEHWETGEKRHVISAYFTFVALNQDKKPAQIPSIIPETSFEKRRFEEAEERRELRIQEARERKKKRAENPIS